MIIKMYCMRKEFVSNKKKRYFQYKQKIMVILLPSQINKKRIKHKCIKDSKIMKIQT